MLTVKEITKFEEFLKIKDVWDRLMAESGIINPYLTHDWFRIAFEYFEKKNDLYILLVYDNNNIIAIAPLLIAREKQYGIFIRKVRFIENIHTPFQDIIITEQRQESLNTLINFLKDNCQKWDLFELKEIRSNSANIMILEDLVREMNFFHYQFFTSKRWTAQTDISWEDGMGKMPAKVRKEFRRKTKRLEKLGKISFQIFTDTAEIEKHLDIFFKIHEQTWKGKEKNAEFYYRIARDFSQRNEFGMYCLSLNEVPIAYMFGIKYKNTLFGIKTTYDPSYYAFSPGYTLFYDILEHSFHEEEIERFDIGRGEERYKQELTSEPIKQISFIAGHNKTFPSILFNARIKLAKFFKAQKVITVTVKYIARLHNLSGPIRKFTLDKINRFREKRQLIIYQKKLVPLQNNYNINGWYCRNADLNDLEHLAVAMKEKNFINLKKRLENEVCFLFEKNDEINSYFWFSLNNLIDTDGDHIVLTQFDPFVFNMDEALRSQMFNMVSNKLIEKKYNVLFAVSKSQDDQKNRFLESLNFQRYK
jgi:hypothetical protein